MKRSEMKAVGIHLQGGEDPSDRGAIAYAALRAVGAEIEVLSCGEISAQDFEEEKKTLFPSPDLSSEYVTALDNDEVCIRSVDLPLKRKGEILKGLSFQLDTLIPYPQETSLVIPWIQKRKKGSKVTLIAFLKEHLADHLQMWGAYQVDPAQVSCVPMALFRFYAYCSSLSQVDEKEDGIVIHLERTHGVLVLIQEGSLQLSRTLNWGLSSLQDPLEKDSREKDLKRSLYFLATSQKGESKGGSVKGITHFLYTGEEEGKEEVSHIVQTALPSISPLVSPSAPPIEDRVMRYAIPVGLALEKYQEQKRGQFSLQLLRGEFSSQREKGDFWRSVSTTLIASLLFTALLFSVSKGVLGYKERRLERRWEKQVIPRIEKEMRRILPASTKKKTIPLLSKIQRTKKGWDQAYQEKILHQKFPPSVGCVLKDIGFYVEEVKGEIALDSFTYHWEESSKRPSRKISGGLKTKFPAIAHVELHLSCEDPSKIREVYQKIKLTAPWVDKTRNILLQAKTDGYQISFFVKNL